MAEPTAASTPPPTPNLETTIYDFQPADKVTAFDKKNGKLEIRDNGPSSENILNTRIAYLAARRVDNAGEGSYSVSETPLTKAQDRYLAEIEVKARYAYDQSLEEDASALNQQNPSNIDTQLKVVVEVRAYRRAIQYRTLLSTTNFPLGMRSAIAEENKRDEERIQSLLKEAKIKTPKDFAILEKKYGLSEQYKIDQAQVISQIESLRAAANSYKKAKELLSSDNAEYKALQGEELQLRNQARTLAAKHSITLEDIKKIKGLPEFQNLPDMSSDLASFLTEQDMEHFQFYHIDAVQNQYLNDLGLPEKTTEALAESRKADEAAFSRQKITIGSNSPRLNAIISFRAYTRVVAFLTAIRTNDLSPKIYGVLTEKINEAQKQANELLRQAGVSLEEVAPIEKKYKLPERSDVDKAYAISIVESHKKAIDFYQAAITKLSDSTATEKSLKARYVAQVETLNRSIETLRRSHNTQEYAQQLSGRAEFQNRPTVPIELRKYLDQEYSSFLGIMTSTSASNSADIYDLRMPSRFTLFQCDPTNGLQINYKGPSMEERIYRRTSRVLFEAHMIAVAYRTGQQVTTTNIRQQTDKYADYFYNVIKNGDTLYQEVSSTEALAIQTKQTRDFEAANKKQSGKTSEEQTKVCSIGDRVVSAVASLRAHIVLLNYYEKIKLEQLPPEVRDLLIQEKNRVRNEISYIKTANNLSDSIIEQMEQEYQLTSISKLTQGTPPPIPK